MQITIQVKSNTLGNSVFEVNGDTQIAGTKHQQVEIAELLSEVIHATCQVYNIPKNLVELETYVTKSQQEPTNRTDRSRQRDQVLATFENNQRDTENTEEEFEEFSDEQVTNAIQLLKILKGLSN